MTPPPSSGPRLSFRDVPPVIYVALGVGLVGSLAVAVATLLSSGEIYDRLQAIERWRALDVGCDVASTLLLALGLLELARRHVGPPRVMAQVGAWLGLASLAWIPVQPLIVLLEPGSDNLRATYDWLGRGTGAAALAGVVLLTLAADAWRRVPLAAAGLIVVGATGYWVPVIGKALAELIGFDLERRQIYGLVRLTVYVPSALCVAAALAAGGRDPAPDPRAAATGLLRARGALLFRFVAALPITLLLIAGRSAGPSKLAVLAGPAVAVVTMLVFAFALQRVAGARLDGMPRLRLSVAAALILWWTTIQLEQVTTLLGLLKSSYGAEDAMRTLQMYSIAGPIAATLGLVLVGSAIAAFASHRGDLALRSAATNRTTTFLVLTLASIAIPSMATSVTTAGGAVMMLLLAVVPAIFGLLTLAALLAQAADALDQEPGIPPARIV